jgi:hypothetical protein
MVSKPPVEVDLEVLPARSGDDVGSGASEVRAGVLADRHFHHDGVGARRPARAREAATTAKMTPEGVMSVAWEAPGKDADLAPSLSKRSGDARVFRIHPTGSALRATTSPAFGRASQG